MSRNEEISNHHYYTAKRFFDVTVGNVAGDNITLKDIFSEYVKNEPMYLGDFNGAIKRIAASDAVRPSLILPVYGDEANTRLMYPTCVVHYDNDTFAVSSAQCAKKITERFDFWKSLKNSYEIETVSGNTALFKNYDDAEDYRTYLKARRDASDKVPPIDLEMYAVQHIRKSDHKLTDSTLDFAVEVLEDFIEMLKSKGIYVETKEDQST